MYNEVNIFLFKKQSNIGALFTPEINIHMLNDMIRLIDVCFLNT
jgi:hypothetical protein